MSRDRTIAFVGPVTQQEGGQCSVLFLQSGHEPPLELIYSTKADAKESRSMLLEAENTYGLRTNTLVHAVWLALHSALKSQDSKSVRKVVQNDPSE